MKVEYSQLSMSGTLHGPAKMLHIARNGLKTKKLPDILNLRLYSHITNNNEKFSFKGAIIFSGL